MLAQFWVPNARQEYQARADDGAKADDIEEAVLNVGIDGNEAQTVQIITYVIHHLLRCLAFDDRRLLKPAGLEKLSQLQHFAAMHFIFYNSKLYNSFK